MLQPMTDQEIIDFEDYLADVLMVWDCYEQAWVEEAPVILRFENVDVLIQRPDDISNDTALSFLAQGFEAEILESEKACEAYIDACICWRRVEDISFLIGHKIKGIEVFQLPFFQRCKRAVEE